MNKIKNSYLFRAISMVLILTFISLDISYAYPSEHNAGNSTLAVPSILQQAPINEQAARFQQSVFSQSALLTSVYNVGEYFFGNTDKGIGSLPSKHAEDALRADLSKHLINADTEIMGIVPVEDIKTRTAPEKLKAALDEIGFKGTLPDEGVVFILYRKAGKKFLVQIARKDNVSPDNLPGYEWVVSDKYVVKYMPEDDRAPQGEVLSLPKDEASQSAPSVQTKEALGQVRQLLKQQGTEANANSVVDNRVRVSEKLEEIRHNSGLPVSKDNSDVPTGVSDNNLWSETLHKLHFDRAVYRRVETTGEKGERTTGIVGATDVSTDLDPQIAELNDYEVSSGPFKSIRLGADLKEGYLMDKDSEVTRDAYFMHRGVFASREDIKKAFSGANKLRFDITVIPPAVWGKEYAKTIGHYHFPVEYPEIYQVVSGEALWIMQKCKIDEAAVEEETKKGIKEGKTPEKAKEDAIKKELDKGEIKDFIVIKAKAGDIVIMLPGYGHISINTSETEPLVMADWLTWHQDSYYGSFNKNRGAAFYAIKNDKGEIELVPNAGYANPPEKIRQMTPKNEIPEFGLKRGEPIYKLVELADAEFIEKTRFLYHPNEYKEKLTPENTLDEVRPEEKIAISASLPVNTIHLNETDLSEFRMKISDAVKNNQVVSVDELISSLPQNSALRNALTSLKQIQGKPTDANIQRIIKENNLNDAEQVAFVLAVQPGQGMGEEVESQKESGNLTQPYAAQASKTTQLFEIIESSLSNERTKFVDVGNKIAGGLDKNMATAEIRQRVEKAIAAIERFDKESVTQETKAAIELLKKNLNQFEADGAVGSLIVLARKAKKENQKLIIGLETDWIPGISVGNSLQRQAITALMKEIDSIAEALQSMGLDNVEVIRGSGNQLADAILAAKEAGNTPTKMHNIVVMASANTINSDGFASLRNADESDRPFLAGIDPTELIKLYTEFGEAVSKQLYIRLASLLYMTLELAAGKEPPQSPIIVSYDKKLRILMLLPKADPMDYEMLKSNYAAEKTALAAA